MIVFGFIEAFFLSLFWMCIFSVLQTSENADRIKSKTLKWWHGKKQDKPEASVVVCMCVGKNKEDKINWGQENCSEVGDTTCATSQAVPVHFSGTEMLIRW